MSNALAIAAVTSTVRFVLHQALQSPHAGPVGGAVVSTLRPDRLSDPGLVTTPGINVFLYNLTPNHAWNLTDLPTRRDDGSLVRRPIAALDLHYLLTGYGEDASLDTQRLLGRAVTALAVTPVLTRDVVAAAIDLYAADTDTGFLADSDLAEQVEVVKLSPTSLTLEELSKLWSVFFQTPYLLSLTYTATVVLLEADVTTRTARPVRQPNITVSAGGLPRLAGADTDPPGRAVVAGTALVLRGTGLLGPQTLVRIGPTQRNPRAGATPQQLIVDLADAVPAGLHSLQVLHRSRPGAGGVPPGRVVATSNAIPVIVRPTVTVQDVTNNDITLTVSPPRWPGQRATVLLNRIDGDADDEPRSRSLVVPPVARDLPPDATLTLPRAEVPNGVWLVQVQVDGIESLPELVGETYGAPALTLPPP